jgi:hypothetical protein
VFRSAATIKWVSAEVALRKEPPVSKNDQPPPFALLVPVMPAFVDWLHDVPLFLDVGQIEILHDVVAKPVVQVTRISKEERGENTWKMRGKISGEATVGLGPLAQGLTFWMLDPKIRTGLEGELAKDKVRKGGIQTELVPITSPGRQLEQIVMMYLAQHPDRLKHVPDPAAGDWRAPDFISKTPRSLVFLDLPSGSKIVPTAAELDGGKVVLFYDKFKGRDGANQPEYPEPEKFRKQEELAMERKKYWAWFGENFNATQAMIAVEKVAEGGRIRWIDYRVPLTFEGDSLHLHFCPEGRYDTGVFAYNLVKRGFKHGLRLVGPLKSEPDMNVLVVYEK